MSATTVAAIHMRRSLGRTAFPAFVILILLNTLLRSMSWRYEWMWAVYQYNFTVILLGPLVAGVAGWEGYRLARSRTFLLGHHRPLALLFAAWGALFAWCAAAFLTGLVVVLAVVVFAGTPSYPGWRELSTPAPAIALLAAEGAAGFAAGWLGRSKLAAPLSAIAVFLGSLLLYSGAGLSAFITVGGASASLVGLEPKVPTQVAQTVFYCLVTFMTLIAGVWLASWYRAPRRAILLVTAGLVIASAVHLGSRSPLFLETRAGDVTCSGSHPRICLGRSYLPYEPRVRKNLAPYYKALDGIGVRTPDEFRQGSAPSDSQVGELGLDTVTGDKDLLLDALLGTYYGYNCGLAPGSGEEKDFTNARYWLADAVGGETYDGDPELKGAMVHGTPREKSAAARDAFRGLMACDA